MWPSQSGSRAKLIAHRWTSDYCYVKFWYYYRTNDWNVSVKKM